jgi:hypothetical protein
MYQVTQVWANILVHEMTLFENKELKIKFLNDTLLNYIEKYLPRTAQKTPAVRTLPTTEGHNHL